MPVRCVQPVEPTKVERVLFLVDHNILINQAKNALTTSLTNLPAANLTRDKEHGRAQIVFSTRFTARSTTARGHFRVLRWLPGGPYRYPRAEGYRDTYHLFGLELGVPTFAYELNRAVSDGYQVPLLRVSVLLKFHCHCIKYKDLSTKAPSTRC